MRTSIKVAKCAVTPYYQRPNYRPRFVTLWRKTHDVSGLFIVPAPEASSSGAEHHLGLGNTLCERFALLQTYLASCIFVVDPKGQHNE